MEEMQPNELQAVPPIGAGRSAAGLAMLIGAGAILLVAGLSAFFFIRAHNELIALEIGIDTQWKQVENQLERQYELLPKLVTIAKRYAVHEREILEHLATARAGYLEASPGPDRTKRAGDVDLAVINALALEERYPDLKADRHFRDLSYEIAGTKNRIAVERKRYNELVGFHATRLKQMPWKWVGVGGEPRPYYQAPREKLVEPKLNLSSL